METRKTRKTVVRLFVLVGLFGFFGAAMAGNLQPSADPNSTMKTLDEVEPRIPIGPATTPGDAEAVFKITQPGSYYLTDNLAGQENKNGIVIAADDVTIDLCGFAFIGVPNSVDGIRPEGYCSNVAIENGIVKGWGVNGVSTYAGGTPFSSSISYARLEGLIVSENGGYGIRGGYGGIIRNCIARDNGSIGIITTNNGGVLENCTSVSNDGDGFSCFDGTVMTNCSSLFNQGDGISGVNIGGQGCSRIEGNNICANSAYGINLTNNPGNFIYRNTLRSNTSGDLNVGAGNSAPSSNNPATAGPWHNIVLTP